MSVLGTCFGLSFDSFVICFVLGLSLGDAEPWLPLAGLFGLLDALATLASGLGVSAAGVVLVSLLALAVAALGVGGRARWRWLALPLLMCIDNLVTPRPAMDAIPVGLTSAAMAGLGFLAAALVARAAPLRRPAGAALVVVGLSIAALSLS